MSDDIESLKEAEKEGVEETHERPAEQRNHNWIAGVVLIFIGAIFLFTNVTDFELDNWWALFILIPALVNFGNAWSSYQQHGRLTQSGRGSLVGGLILSLIASAFLFDLDWGLIWPIFLIIGGIAALMGNWFD
jgi:hypothetical protein